MNSAAKTIQYDDVSDIVFFGEVKNNLGAIQPVHAATVGWEELKLAIKQEAEELVTAALAINSLL